MDRLERFTSLRKELLEAIDRGHVPTWLVEAVSTTFGELTACIASGADAEAHAETETATLARARTLLEVLRSYRTSPPIGSDPTRR